MANSSSCQVPETDSASLKEKLCGQQQLLQKLYSELDVEREASATAASEALSMILRLQGEKAAMQMEASQYQRMTEERMGIVEEYLAAYEDLILQKEMEIASLEHQIEAYRYKLLSVSSSDLDFDEDNLLLQRSGSLLGEMGDVSIRRRNSLPPIWLQDSCQSPKKGPRERDRASFHRSGLIPRKMDETTGREFQFQTGLEMKSGNSACQDIKSQWEMIRNIIEQMKERSDSKDASKHKTVNLKSEPRLLHSLSQVSTTSTSYETPRCQLVPELDQINESGFFRSFSSLNAQDIFEVAETCEEFEICEKKEKENCKLILEGGNRFGKLDSVPEETLKSHIKQDEIDCIKTMQLSTNNENRASKPEDGIIVDDQVAIARTRTSVSKCEAEIQQLSQRIQRIEQLKGERTVTRNETSQEQSEELHLLKEIHEQLNSIKSEMRCLRSKKSPPQDDWRMFILQEAMLHFWL